MANNTIMFIHGLWMHSNTWDPWMQFFTQHGYNCINPGWPGDGDTVAASRANTKAIANRGVKEVANQYAALIGTLPSKPILIGHSFGGLIVQILLGRGTGAAGIAIDPAPMKGIWQLPFSALKASFPVLRNPFNLKRSVSLSFNQFHYAFTNTLSRQEAQELYDSCTVPSPALPLFQAAFATLNPFAETRVNTSNPTRGPLLITAGARDHTVPPVLSKAAYQKYSKSPAITELKSFDDRGHSLTIDHGWQDVADYSLNWLKGQGL